jgi:hypothetical protein
MQVVVTFTLLANDTTSLHSPAPKISVRLRNTGTVNKNEDLHLGGQHVGNNGLQLVAGWKFA